MLILIYSKCGADKCNVCRKNIHDILGEDSKRKSVSTAGKKLDLWDEFYRGIFRDRAEAIIDAHVKKGVAEVLNTLEAVKDDLKVTPRRNSRVAQFVCIQVSIRRFSNYRLSTI